MALRMITAPSREQALAQLALELDLVAVGYDGEVDPRLERLVVFERRYGGPAWWPFGFRPWGHVRWEIFVEAEALDAEPRAQREAEMAARQYHALETEMASLRQGMAHLVRSADLARLPRCGKVLADCYDQLRATGMLPELAQELVLAARDELSTSAQKQPAAVEAAVRRQHEARLQLREPHVVPGTGPLVIFLVGPTGVGKTTTVAKLAKRQALLDGRRLAVINADTTRPGAQQQLELLLQPLSIKVESVKGVEEFTSLLACLSDHDVIVVDTAGVGRCEHPQLEQLRDLIERAPRRQAFLVLSASTSYEEMSSIVAAYRGAVGGVSADRVLPDGLILSKLDETDALGAAATLACRCSIPTAYLSMGRRTMQDLEQATAARLSSMVLLETGGKLQRVAEPLIVAAQGMASAPVTEVAPPRVVSRTPRNPSKQPKESRTKESPARDHIRRVKELAA